MPKVAEKRRLAVSVLDRCGGCVVLGLALAACGPASGNAGRSPLWGVDPLMPPLSAYVEAPDLEERLQAIEAETQELGLKMTFEAKGKLPAGGGTVVVRAYEGRDALGRPTHAVRAATPRGVIMAVGPRSYTEPEAGGEREATELIPALVPDGRGGGAFEAATDINGDGYPDVVLRNEEGVMEVWRLGPMGSGRYEIRLEAPATSAEDIDGDGRVDFVGTVAGAPGDVLSPDFIDFAVFDGGGYSNRAAGAREAHSQRAKALEALQDGSGAATASGSVPASEAAPGTAPATATESGAATAPATRVSDEVRLRRALSLAWHSILAGRPRKEALKKLDEEPVPANLRAEFERYKRRVERALSH